MTAADSSARSVLSPEARVLLTSVESDLPGRETERLLRESLEWGKLYGLAARERALGPLWEHLSRFGGRLPEEFSRGLEQAAALEQLRQLRLGKRLEETLGVLNDAGVTPGLLKGAALIQTCYADVRDRPMVDFDLLVSPGEAERARNALLAADWVWDRERYPAAMYDRHYHMPPLEDAGGRDLGLELHTGLLIPGHPFDFGPEDLRAAAGTVDVGGRVARVPAPVPHLVYVCLHFAWSHCLGSGAWRTFRDVGRVARSEEFDWGRFAGEAESAGASAAAYWTLRLRQELAGGEVPDAVLRRLRPPLPEPVLERLARHFSLGLLEPDGSCPSVGVQQLLWLLGNRWGQGGTGGLFGRGTSRPWDFSGDFAALHDDGADPERSMSVFRRHIGERARWFEYLRQMAVPASRDV